MADTHPRTAILGSSLTDLQSGRTSAKWENLAGDVLPMWVAEMDSVLAQPIADALHAAVERSDTGYAAHDSELPAVFADFAQRRWGWSVTQPVIPFTDVGVAITDLLRHLCRPGDGVIVTTPVYPSFFSYFDAVGVRPVEVPLIDIGDGGRLDLDGIDAAMRAGARALLLANPHNPTGTVHSRADLSTLAALAERYGVRVVSDEIHAPLTFSHTEFTPYLEVAGDTAVAAHSASKAWNIAGLKCGLLIGADLPSFSDQVAWAVGHFGVIASIAAYRDSEAWLDQLIGELEHNAEVVAGLLADTLPQVGYCPGAASYFAWLDCRRLDLGADPAGAMLDRARVKVSDGVSFGGPGAGWVRMNIGTSPEIIATALGRIAALR
ncbi:MalY/PatB family protein [Williamsia maris]|uniref:MalY/PatB family protein n=1 Tax=Williamsia maris TaxID=72806 RepID=UPI0020A2559B|nr:aminotransferase class I/II-fold pyridoxal phosphate-dependent enzyme [Williamsia maris]